MIENGEIEDGGMPLSGTAYAVKPFGGSVRCVAPDGSAVDLPPGSEALAAAVLETLVTKEGPLMMSDDQLVLTHQKSGRTLRLRAGSIESLARLLRCFSLVRGGLDGGRPIDGDDLSPVRIPEAAFLETNEAFDAAPASVKAVQGVKPVLAGGDGAFALVFAAVEMAEDSKYRVAGAAEPADAKAWGYDVQDGEGRHAGWLVVLGAKDLLLTGFAGRKHTRHTSMSSAMVRLTTYMRSEGA